MNALDLFCVLAVDRGACPAIRRNLSDRAAAAFADWLRVRRVPSIHARVP